ncbi:hypothetical protein IFM89_009882 [Coptis chinensis]|uniref:DUF6821 domain-containing protein n=1 Tax=Coptis chinensis TaxID=261450 RepID=A0A835M2P0_9MAGN|nr:hypothetical protein IFM89_009882 [Coptis chinensis]
MEEEAPRDFQDWELLHNKETGLLLPPDSFVDIEGVSEGVIRPDYFAFDTENRYGKTIVGETVDESGGSSVSSDNPSWIEPCSESTRFIDDDDDDDQRVELRRKVSTEFWSDSSSDESAGSRKFIEFDGNEEMGNRSGSVDGEAPEEVVEVEAGEGEKKEMVWWKFPFEILKFCLFKVSPGWTISIAAAVMGIVILRRRLHRMKKKNQSIALKLTVDDKKVSQLMNRSTRLNEAFSVVRNVPMIRPLLPSPGLTPWPILNLR